MIVLKLFGLILVCFLINKMLTFLSRHFEDKIKNTRKIKSVVSRADLLDYGVDYYLFLCKYIVSKMPNTDEILIQDISGREVVDIKFNQNGSMVYSSCILKEKLDDEKFELVTYSEVLDLLNFMIKDNVSKGVIFVNSDLDDSASKFIDDLNKNSGLYSIDVVKGYEIIKFARKRNEESFKELRYA